MKPKIQTTTSFPTPEELFDSLIRHGMKCYRYHTCYFFIWLPWAQKAIDLNCPGKVKRYFALPNLEYARVFNWHCQNHMKPFEVADQMLLYFPFPENLPARLSQRFDVGTKWAQDILIATNKQQRN